MRTGIYALLCGLAINIGTKYGFEVTTSTVLGMIISAFICTVQDWKEIFK